MGQNIYQEILDRIAKNEMVMLETAVKGRMGKVTEGITRTLKEAIPKIDEKGRCCYRVEAVTDGDGMIIREPMTSPERLIIFGGGHVSLSLSQFAAACGFSVCVVDDRQEFANRERFPHVAEIICDTFQNAVCKLKITPCDFVVIITRGHAHDAECLRAILPGTQPAYLGMIGSRRRVRAQFEMLIQEGYEKEKLDRIHTPIGLNIGGVTPAEIGISIMAEIIACKRMPQPDRGEEHFFNESDLEADMLEKLAQEKGSAVLVTLIESNGSTPRKAGAKMMIKPDGSMIGTIGGGLSEGLSRKAALDLIGTGEYKILDFDLSGNVAQAEGMACGGFSRVLIEDMQ
ncbi:MAG: XdhC family protein [Muricoprocola sp.]